jgi:hypothetical protein
MESVIQGSSVTFQATWASLPRVCTHHQRQMLHNRTENYYQILGVSPKDSYQTIKSAYRSLVLKFHPDKTAQEISQFFPIQKAWETLRSLETKGKYDAFLDLQSRIIIYDTIQIQEMNCTGTDLFTFPCRCGGSFEFSNEENPNLIPICIPCSDCSLYLQVQSS